MRIQCISRWRLTSSLPTTGTLFSAWQLTTHRRSSPMQLVRSTDHAPVVPLRGHVVLGPQLGLSHVVDAVERVLRVAAR